MNNKLLLLLTTVISFGTGAVTGYIYSKKKYEKLADTEVESIKKKLGLYLTKEKQEEQVSDQKPEVPEKDTDISVGFNKTTKKEYQNYSAHYRSNETKEEGKEEDEEADPYIIDLEELAASNYDVKTLLYYQDGILTDDDNNVITEQEQESMIGKSVLTAFNNNDLDVLYVRNDRLQLDYEILLESRNYYHSSERLHSDSE